MIVQNDVDTSAFDSICHILAEIIRVGIVQKKSVAVHDGDFLVLQINEIGG